MAKKRKFSPGDVVYNVLAGSCDVVEVFRNKNGKRRVRVVDVSGDKFVVKPRHLDKAGDGFVSGCLYRYKGHIIKFVLRHYTGESVGTVHRITDKIGYNLLKSPYCRYPKVIHGVLLSKDDFSRMLQLGEIVPVGINEIRTLLLLR